METLPIHRRRFLGRVINTALGLAGTRIAYLATRDFWTGADPAIRALGNIPEVFGEGRLRLHVSDIIRTYASAEAGEVMAYNQLFWTSALVPEILWALPHQASNIEFPNRQNRLRAFPAIACIHALPILSNDDWHRASELITKIHFSAAMTSPDRLVVESIWQNATAAIIRNPENYDIIQLPQGLIDQGLDCCQQFLKGNEVLFSTFVFVWQCILTYRQALRQRHKSSALEMLEKSIDRLSSLDSSPQYYWIIYMEGIYRNRNQFIDLLPQPTEILMGRQQFARSVADFAFITRLKSLYITHQLASGKISSPYLPTERAKDFLNTVHKFFGDYLVTPEYWRSVRQEALALIGFEAVSFFDSYADTISPLVLAVKGNRTGIRRLGALVPFRFHDEVALSARVYRGAALEDLAKMVTIGGMSVGGITTVAEPIATLEIQQITGWDPRNLTFQGTQPMVEEDDPFLLGMLGLLERHQAEVEKLARNSSRAPHGRSPQGAALRSLDISRTERMEEDKNNLTPVVAEIIQGLKWLQTRNPEILREFNVVYVERSEVPELPEGSSIFDGLEQVLNMLLRVAPRDNFIQRAAETQHKSEPADECDPELVSLVDRLAVAAKEIKYKSPNALALFSRNTRRREISAGRALGALMLMYVDNKEVYPY